jgi:hypothetical protein
MAARKTLAFLIEDAQVHGSCVQVDAAIELLRAVVESSAVIRTLPLRKSYGSRIPKIEGCLEHES